jgi:hypothetical protein
MSPGRVPPGAPRSRYAKTDVTQEAEPAAGTTDIHSDQGTPA